VGQEKLLFRWFPKVPARPAGKDKLLKEKKNEYQGSREEAFILGVEW
jgi:hypothetical protein